jgi:hypothetical protein
MHAFSHVFPPDDGGSTCLRNVGKFLPRHVALLISTDVRTSHFPRVILRAIIQRAVGHRLFCAGATGTRSPPGKCILRRSVKLYHEMFPYILPSSPYQVLCRL